MRVRPVGESDIAAWHALRRECWPKRAPERLDANASRVLGDPVNRVALLCFPSGGSDFPIGFIELTRGLPDEFGTGDRPACVDGLHVAAERDRTQVLGALLDCARGWAIERGCRELRADIPEDDVCARQLHEALGFEARERRVVFALPLPSPSGANQHYNVANTSRPAAEPAAGDADSATHFVVYPRRRSGWMIHTAVGVVGVVSFAHTNIWSDQILNGAILPLVDFVFVIYFVALLLHRRFRVQTDDRDRQLALYREE